MTGARGASLQPGPAPAGAPRRVSAPRRGKPGPTLSLWDEQSLGQEPRWNAGRRARPQTRCADCVRLSAWPRAASSDAEVMEQRLSAFHFPFVFLSSLRGAKAKFVARSPGLSATKPGGQQETVLSFPDFAELVIGPATSGRTRWLNPGYGSQRRGRTRISFVRCDDRDLAGPTAGQVGQNQKRRKNFAWRGITRAQKRAARTKMFTASAVLSPLPAELGCSRVQQIKSDRSRKHPTSVGERSSEP